MFPFISVETPDQLYRLLTSLCMHAGILHLAITLIFQHLFLADLERLIGTVRTAIVYIMSGFAGNLTSAILVPHRPEVQFRLVLLEIKTLSRSVYKPGWTLGISQRGGGLADRFAGVDALEVSAQAAHRPVQVAAPVQRAGGDRNTALSTELPGIAGWRDLWLPSDRVPSAIYHILQIWTQEEGKNISE